MHPALRHTIFVFQPDSSSTPQSSAPGAPPIAEAFSQGFSDLVSCFGFCLPPPEPSLITLARSTFLYWFSTVQLSHSVVFDSLQPHGQRHSRLPCPSPNLPEVAQTHVHQVSNDIQPSHPLSSPSPPGFNLAQHQSPFQWVSSSYQLAKVLEFQL